MGYTELLLAQEVAKDFGFAFPTVEQYGMLFSKATIRQDLGKWALSLQVVWSKYILYIRQFTCPSQEIPTITVTVYREKVMFLPFSLSKNSLFMQQ